MTIPPESLIRERFADMRRLTRQDKVRKTPAGDIEYCQLEEDLIALFDRQRRVPTAMVKADGFPSGGSEPTRGSSGYTTTERAALADQPGAVDEHGYPVEGTPRIELDTLGPALAALWPQLDMAGRGATKVRTITIEQTLTAKRHPVSLGRTVAECCEEGCTSIAVTGESSRFPGRCEADRKWLERKNEKAEREGTDPIRSVPREVIERRDNPPKRHEHEQTDDVVSRLVAGYEEAAG